MATAKPRILITDSDINLSTILTDYLNQQGFKARTEDLGDETRKHILSGQYDLCILSTNMLSIRWSELLHQLRSAECNTPIIILSESQSREDAIQAFRLGADDYVLKPFSIEVLICRIEAILRRCYRHERDTKKTYILDGREFDSVRQTFDGKHISSRESDLLLMLCRHEGEVVDRHAILRALWKADDRFAARSLCVYVNHLRNILVDTRCRIIGVHSKGYKLVCDC